MGFRFGYMLPSVYLTFWWIYSISQGKNESAAYLSLYIAASIPIPLIFVLLDRIANRSPLLQLAIDSVIFVGLYLSKEGLIKGQNGGDRQSFH